MLREPLRTIVIEDERLAREELVQQLAALPGVSVVGSAGDIEAGLALMREAAPQLSFLDIELADGCGFDLLAAAPRDLRTIVVSACEAHALRAFEVNVVDYLLKPVQPERLRVALERVFASRESLSDELSRLGYDDCVFLALGDGQANFVAVNRIVVVEADGDYSRVRTCDGHEYRVLKPLKHWEQRLPLQAFARIHRSTLVNLRRVRGVDAWLNSRFRVHLEGLPRPLTMSRRHAATLRQRFE